jgi:3-oxoacyl-[acyl-carrier-protein] synthase-3
LKEYTNALITGTGSYLPEKIMTNADFEKMVDTSDEWILTRTGIKTRHHSKKNETTADMSLAASARALEMAQVKPEDLDLIIVATVTSDYILPATATLIQAKLGAHNAAAFDISAACAGFIHALEIGRNMIVSGDFKKILVIGAEKLSQITNFQDRSTCVLFGDGAGAAVVEIRIATV